MTPFPLTPKRLAQLAILLTTLGTIWLMALHQPLAIPFILTSGSGWLLAASKQNNLWSACGFFAAVVAIATAVSLNPNAYFAVTLITLALAAFHFTSQPTTTPATTRRQLILLALVGVGSLAAVFLASLIPTTLPFAMIILLSIGLLISIGRFLNTLSQ